MPTKNDDEFEFRPLIPGACVPLRGVAERVGPNGGREGRLEFAIATGEGVVDGVKFDVRGTIGCNVEVTFRRGGEHDMNAHTYHVAIRDVIEAAWNIDKTKPAAAGDSEGA